MTTVMVVEDSPVQREMLSNLLIRGGLNVMSAGDGIEALKLLRTQRPDLILLDILMPRMNGYEVCRRLKNHPKTRQIPIAMCSSKGQDCDRYWAMRQGADAYLVKPFEPMELVKILRQLLKRSHISTESLPKADVDRVAVGAR